MTNPYELVVWLHDVKYEDVAQVGKEAAKLAEYTYAKFPVASGFVITASAFRHFFLQNQLFIKIKHLLGTINPDHGVSVEQVSQHIQSLIYNTPFPDEIVEKIFSYHQELTKFESTVLIKPSFGENQEISPSFAHHTDSLSHIEGEATLIEKIKYAYALLFDAKSLLFYSKNNFDSQNLTLSLIVQSHINAEVSGKIYTSDPITNDKSTLIIEAIFGVYKKSTTPDQYIVAKNNLEVKKITVTKQETFLQLNNGVLKDYPCREHHQQKINESEILSLAKLGVAIEKHTYFPQEIEWVQKNKNIYITHIRSLFATVHKQADHSIVRPATRFEAILTGVSVTPGLVCGPIAIITNTSEAKKIQRGDIAVLKNTDISYRDFLRNAAGLIVEEGGISSHAAFLAQELGIPAIVGAKDALKVLKSGMIVTLDAKAGVVHKGNIHTKSNKVIPLHRETFATKTKVAVYANDSISLQSVSPSHVEEILFQSNETIKKIGIHPRKLLHDGEEEKLVTAIVNELRQLATTFYPKNIFYIFSNLTSADYKKLEGGEMYEEVEKNPLLGYHGAEKFVMEKELFELELHALKKAREVYELSNIQVAIPFVRTSHEAALLCEYIKSSVSLANVPVGVMLETPSAILCISEISKHTSTFIVHLEKVMELIFAKDFSQSTHINLQEATDSVFNFLSYHMQEQNPASITILLPHFLQTDAILQKILEMKYAVGTVPSAVEVVREMIYNTEKKYGND